MRLAAAIAAIAVAFSAAFYIHQRHPIATRTDEGKMRGYLGADKPIVTMTFRTRTHPSWEDRVALLIAVGGIAVAVGIVAHRRPNSPNPPSPAGPEGAARSHR